MMDRPQRDSAEFVLGVLLGAASGAAVAALLAPDRSPRGRLRRRLRGPVRGVRRRAEAFRAATKETRRRSLDLTRASGELGEEFVRAVREEFLAGLRHRVGRRLGRRDETAARHRLRSLRERRSGGATA
jgi:gas vesicle protein